MIDLTPTLLSAAGVTIPESMKGHNLMPLITSPQARQEWDNTAYIQINSKVIARAIRTQEWCYCVADTTVNGENVPSSMSYQEYVLYNLYSDPAQLTNLIGREDYKSVSRDLKAQLQRRMIAAGEKMAQITSEELYA
jgi:arylsulfatase A-like enzyme